MGQGKYPIPPPMNPMMYMYPGMSPYMPYYHPGYMPQGGMRYHFDGYRTPLNPYAEPWNPHSQQQVINYSKICLLSDHSKIDKTKILMTNGSLMKVKSITECSPWSIL